MPKKKKISWSPKIYKKKFLKKRIPLEQYKKLKRFRNNLIVYRYVRYNSFNYLSDMIQDIQKQPQNFWNYWEPLYIPKKSGGFRIVYKPQPILDQFLRTYLRLLQKVDEVEDYLITNDIIEKTNMRELFKDETEFSSYQVVGNMVKNSYSYGFEKGKNIIMNASQHKDNQYFLKMDIHSAFPSIKKDSVFKILYFYEIKLENIIAVLECIIYNESCYRFLVENDAISCRRRKRRNRIKFIENVVSLITTNNFLITGASLSPFILNHYLYNFDKHVSSYCQAHHLTYTRYADDITISGNEEIGEDSHLFVKHMLNNWGFKENPKKTIKHSYKRKNVITGIVVSYDDKLGKGKVGIGYKRFNKLKKDLYRLQQGKVSDNEKKKIMGMLNFLRSVDIDRYHYLVNKYKVKI